MKSRLRSKISVAILACMLLNLSLPVLIYAASYIKVEYDSSSGRIHGVIYTDQATVSLNVYSNGMTKNIGSIGPAHEIANGGGYFFNIDNQIDLGLALKKITLNDGQVKDFSNFSVANSVYTFEHANTVSSPSFWTPTQKFDDSNGTVNVKLRWTKSNDPSLEKYNIYRNDLLIGSTKEGTFLVKDLPYLSHEKFDIEAVNRLGVKAPKNSRSLRTLSRLQLSDLGMNNKPVGYSLQKGDPIVSFSPVQQAGGFSNTQIILNFGSAVKTNFKGEQHLEFFQVDDSQLSKDDFNLVDEQGSFVPITTLSTFGPYNETIIINLAQSLENNKKYTLEMSSTSFGNEIRLPNAASNSTNFTISSTNGYLSSIFKTKEMQIGDYFAPAKPTSLAITAKDGGIEAAWGANTESDLSGYLVYLDGELLTANPITATSYSISGLQNGKTYHVNVAAVDNAGNRSKQAYAFPTPVGSSGGLGGGGGFFLAPEEPGVKTLKSEDLKPENGKIPVKLSEDVRKLKFPANAEALAPNNALAISKDNLNLEIPGSLIGQLQKLVTAEELKDAQISVSFDKLAQESAQETMKNAESNLKNTTLKAGGDIYELSLTITTKDGKEHKLTAFDAPIKLKLKIADGANTQLIGIYYIGDDGRLEYVGGELEDGYMVAEVTHFSKYAIVEFSKKFNDVAEGNWAFQAISTLVAKHVIDGVSETSFAPEKKVTRAEFAALLARRLGLKASIPNSFTDVKASKWYANDVTAAVEAGIVKGRTTKTFAPDDALTRQEMTVMLMKAYELLSGKTIPSGPSAGFTDKAEIGSWAISSVNAASELGFVKGRGKGNFDPQGTASRAEAAQVISKL
ncbi:S-layer homology domain-containing protein [Cohnella lupini]|uniref:S-layer family protein n=1 Tax=Cohnella lupini TaxID=1294267 RepID=A0A3D9I7M3_9BACL|nr:S-layer homology domain-containing protein [Cohnella lupini]RED57539.1 S-layer family protein [Cohnella lupini]